jgi:hypothetical protein
LYGIDTIDDATRARVELIDLGCGEGGSLESAMRRFGVEGIGVELHAPSVVAARRKGLHAFQADILDLDASMLPSVKYVMIDNVLEHLPDLDGVEQVLGQSFRLASHLVHVRHPSFEDEEYLASLGLKQYWADWPEAHTCHIRLHEFVAMANRQGCYRIRMEPVFRAVDSSDGGILPIDAPPNQRRIDPKKHGAYDQAVHGPKPFVTFDRPVYFAFDLLFLLGPGEPTVKYNADTETDPGRPWISWGSGT